MNISVTREELAELCGHCELIKLGGSSQYDKWECDSCVLNRICVGQHVQLYVTEIAILKEVQNEQN